eukprot:9995872-Alexandrium_andersonii.AAC.1
MWHSWHTAFTRVALAQPVCSKIGPIGRRLVISCMLTGGSWWRSGVRTPGGQEEGARRGDLGNA